MANFVISHVSQTIAGVDILTWSEWDTTTHVTQTLEDPTNYLFPSSKAYFL
jgi:hypothetical protein